MTEEHYDYHGNGHDPTATAEYLPETEKALLGAIIIDPHETKRIVDNTLPAWFTSTPHRVTFEAMKVIHGRGDPIEPIGIIEELQRAGLLDNAGGIASIFGLTDGVASSVYAETYAEQLKTAALRRQILIDAGKLARLVNTEDPGGALDEFIQHLQELRRKATSGGRYDVLTAADFLKPLEPIDWVVNGLFSAGSVSLIVGEGGTKKTYAMLDCAVCVALGMPWLRFETSHGAVLIVDEESGPRRLARRFGDVLRGHGGDADTPVYATALARFNVADPSDVYELQLIIENINARFVVIDALADIMPGADENAVSDVQPIFMALRTVAEETQAAITVIHHANKLGKYRGSTAMQGAVDLMLQVESKPDSEIVDFKTTKARDIEPASFSALARFSPDEFYMIETSQDTPGVSLSKAQRYVIRYLTSVASATVTEIKGHADSCAPSTARDALYALVDLGYCERIDAGGQGSAATYSLTESGCSLGNV